MRKVSALMATCLALVCLPCEAQFRADLEYRHFLFFRHNEAGGVAMTDSLVMATIGPDGFKLRDLFTSPNLGGGSLLAVVGGKVYILSVGQLLCVDVATGKCMCVVQHVGESAYADGKLFSVRNRELSECDFGLGAWRPIMTIEGWPTAGGGLAASPDGKRLAFFLPPRAAEFARKYPNVAIQFSGWDIRLHVVDVEARNVRGLLDRIRYAADPTESYFMSAPPLAWIDQGSILFVRSGPPEKPTSQMPGEFHASGSKRLAIANVEKGEVRDIVALPGGEVEIKRGITIRPPHIGMPPLVHITHLFPPSDERYTVDVQAGKLLETEAIGKDFHVRGQGRRQELYHGQKLLGHVSSWHSAAVAPDQQQVIWTGRDREQALHYYDAKEGVVQVVAKGWFAEGWDEGRLLWFKDDALKPPATPQALSADWKPFEHSPYPPPPRQWKDQRKPITDYLTFTLSCDKKEYKLHEPVKVTMTLTNRGEQELKVHRPRICWGILELAVKRPDFGSLITRHWDIKEFSPVVLKPGASVSGTEAIELTRVGTHDLDGEVNLSTLQALNPSAQFSGRLKAAPVSFAVQSSAEDVKLLAAKMDRLMGELRAQHSKAPNDTKLWMPAQGDMREVGEEAVPFLLDALRQETDARLRARLVYVLQHIASPAALPAFHEALASNAPDCQEFAIGGFYQLCARNTPAKPEAVEALIGALSRDLPQELRNWTLRYLTLIHDPAVKAAFEKALEAEDPFVAPKAGRYVAGWEGKNLADWLATAAQQPTKIRFVAARAIVNELRASWHMDKFGDLSGLAWNDVSKGGEALARFRQVLSVWEAWARENPRASATFFRKPSDDKDDE